MSIDRFRPIVTAPTWLEPALIGSDLSSLVHLGSGEWQFGFGDHCTLTTYSLWRIIRTTGIVVTSEDHGQQFGLPHSVDVCEAVMNAVQISLGVTEVLIAPATADLRLNFGPSVSLDVINSSAGYEAWQLSLRLEAETLQLVAMGGGSLSVPEKQRE
jgi:hypothetical protein